jgi:hypothetical protein
MDQPVMCLFADASGFCNPALLIAYTSFSNTVNSLLYQFASSLAADPSCCNQQVSDLSSRRLNPPSII